MHFGNCNSFWTDSNIDLAIVKPNYDLALSVNSVGGDILPVQFKEWWGINNTALDKLNIAKTLTVVKCGVSSKVTTGKVVGYFGGNLMVTGNEVTSFANPGDSGSIVFNRANNGDIVSVIVE